MCARTWLSTALSSSPVPAAGAAPLPPPPPCACITRSSLSACQPASSGTRVGQFLVAHTWWANPPSFLEDASGCSTGGPLPPPPPSCACITRSSPSACQPASSGTRVGKVLFPHTWLGGSPSFLVNVSGAPPAAAPPPAAVCITAPLPVSWPGTALRCLAWQTDIRCGKTCVCACTHLVGDRRPPNASTWLLQQVRSCQPRSIARPAPHRFWRTYLARHPPFLPSSRPPPQGRASPPPLPSPIVCLGSRSSSFPLH